MLNKGKATKLKAGTSSVLPFDPNGKIFRWGPVPGKFFYLSIFCEVHYKHFRKKFKKNWSETLYLFREGRMFWVNELEAVEKAGEEVFLEYMLPRAVRRSIYQEWKENASKLTDFEEKIGKAANKKGCNQARRFIVDGDSSDKGFGLSPTASCWLES